MANHEIFLTRIKIFSSQKWRKRKYRRGLIYFFESLSLYLKAGFSLSYCWGETLRALKGEIPEELENELRGGGQMLGVEESLGQVLENLKNNCHIESYRMWFAVLSDLYISGAGLTRSVEALVMALRREQEVDLEAHCRSLPLKVNIVLILFFLPPIFLSLLGPLVREILTQFD
ncbi:MAG: hypothetical protein ACKOA8_19215 [Deltaproteobacteria bacterium]